MDIKEVRAIIQRDLDMYKKILHMNEHLYKLQVYDKTEDDVINLRKIIKAYEIVLDII